MIRAVFPDSLMFGVNWSINDNMDVKDQHFFKANYSEMVRVRHRKPHLAFRIVTLTLKDRARSHDG